MRSKGRIQLKQAKGRRSEEKKKKNPENKSEILNPRGKWTGKRNHKWIKSAKSEST